MLKQHFTLQCIECGEVKNIMRTEIYTDAQGEYQVTQNGLERVGFVRDDTIGGYYECIKHTREKAK